jgi:SSS family solute:Na+ symporter
MYMAITGAIYMGGSGSAIIGGLYWKRGTTTAAWVGMITGSSLALINIITQQLWDHGKIPIILAWLWSKLPFLESHWKLDALVKSLPSRFPINGMTGYFFAVVAAIVAYVTISLIQNKQFDLNKILHRDEKKVLPIGPRQSRLIRFLETIGMTGTEFTRGDKILYLVTFSWSMGWSLVFIGILICHFFFDISTQWWLKFWRFFILYVPLTVSAIVIPLFFTLGFRDAIRMFRRLSSAKRSTSDDGSVTEHSNLSDTSVPVESNRVARILPDDKKETA